MPDTKELQPRTFRRVSRAGVFSEPTNLVSVGSHGNAKRPRKSEISQLEVVGFIDEQVLRLEVSM